MNGRVDWRLGRGVALVLDASNLFGARDSDVDHVYVSRLPGEPAEGVTDRHFHPALPRIRAREPAARLVVWRRYRRVDQLHGIVATLSAVGALVAHAFEADTAIEYVPAGTGAVTARVSPIGTVPVNAPVTCS